MRLRIASLTTLVTALGVGLLSALLAACGGGTEPKPKTQDDAPEVESHPDSTIQTSSEIGGLNEQRVDATFSKTVGALQKCLESGAERIEFLGGSVSFFLSIGADGRVDHAHLERSTLGDRETEKCMLAALRARRWPKPVGGEHGLARKSFDFDAPNDVRPPTEWEPDQVQKAVQELGNKLHGCKKSASGSFEATAYVSTDGTVLAASVTPPDSDGEAAVDCLVDALKSATFPSPGSWPAKVTFSL